MLRGFVGVIVAGLLGAGGAVVGLMLSGDDRYPEDWTAEIKPFVEIVEDERGLDFEHPVYVEFLSEAEFEKQVTADEDDLSDEDLEDIEQSAGLLRAVGLIDGDVDLFDATNSLQGAGTLAYYSTKDERIRIRGESLTPAIEATLVHELTHALQDQHFDIGDRAEALEEADDDGATSGFQALIEGDANRIETAYVEGLDDLDAAAVLKEQKESVKRFRERSADLPQVLATLLTAPYSLGEAMLRLATDDGGNDAVDELFALPPTSEEHLLDPWKLIADRELSVDVKGPSLVQEDVDVTGSGTFGAMGWLFMLAERIPLLQALDASDGWGGDAYVSFEYAGKSCVRVNYRGDTGPDVKEMETALRRWMAAVPDSAGVVRDSGGLSFTACDARTDVDEGSRTSQDALNLALTRTYLSVGLLDGGAERDEARCLSNSLLHAFSVEQLNDPDLVLTDQMEARVQQLAADCKP